MTDIFLSLLNLSITASWLILAVVIVRLLFKKAPRWVICVLWAFVGVRLVFPFSVESVFSLIPSAQTVPPTIVYASEPQISSGIYAVNRVVNPIIEQSFAPDPSASVNPLQVVLAVASAVWIIGVAAMVAYAFFSYIRLKHLMKTATHYKENIYQSESVESPFVLGFIKPKIYLTYSINESDISHVIAHEKAHIKRKDHFIKPLGFLLLSVYWFNPIIWVAYILLCRDIELACDEKVVKEFGETERKEYSYALLNCSVNRRKIAACPLAFGEVGVKDRIKSVMNYKKPAFWIIVASVAASVIVALCFMTNPQGDLLVNIEGLNFPQIWGASISNSNGILETSKKEEVDAISEFVKSIKVSKNPVNDSRSDTRESDYSVSFTVAGADINNLRFLTYNFNSDCTQVWVNNFVKPTLSYKVKQPQKVKEFFESYSIFCNTYVAGDVVFADGYHSMVGGVTGNYFYEFDSGMTLKEKTSGVLGWSTLGQMGEYVLDEHNFDNTFSTSLDHKDFSPKKLRLENEKAWRLFIDKESESDSLYMLLEQKNGDLYMIKGKNEHSTRWVYKLEKTSDTAPKNLESAVSEAVLANNHVVFYDTWRSFESHWILDEITEKDGDEEIVRVYALTLHEDYYINDLSMLVRNSSKAVPVMMSFEKKSDGSYILIEYAEHDPKKDKQKYDEISALFPDAVNRDNEREMEFMSDNCYEQASVFFGIGDYTVRYGVRELMPYVSLSAKMSDSIYISSLNKDNLYINSIQHLPIFKFDSLGELIAFRDSFGDKSVFDADYDECPSFNEYISKFNEAYFESESLLLIYVDEPSGSFRHQVGQIVVENGALCVTVNAVKPEVYTFDEASWFVPVQVSKNVTDSCTLYDAVKGEDVEQKAEFTYTYNLKAENDASPLEMNPVITLYNNGQANFFYSPLSSLIIYGGYEIRDGYLIITEDIDSGTLEYYFKYDGAKLVFDAEKSAPIPDYNKIGTPVPDGAIFE